MSKHVTRMMLEEAEHYTPQQRKDIEKSYPEHERDARVRGLPVLGSGLVFPLGDEVISCDPIPLPKHWARINGVDFGWEHPFAAISMAHDRDGDVLYVTHAYRIARATPVIHAAAVKVWGVWIPCAWPHDGLQHDKGSGEGLTEQYRRQGLNMLVDHAEFEAGGTGVEAGVMEMLDRMQTGRLKVFRNLSDWFGEKRNYHREDGIIVKLHDDLLCATRYALMMLRHAVTEPQKSKPRPATAHSTWAA